MELIPIIDIKYTESIKNINNFIDASILKSIKTYGQLYPIIIDKENNIIKGRTIYRMCKDLSIDNVWVNQIECNSKQLYLELSLLQKEVNVPLSFAYMKEIDKENNCLPFSKDEVKSFIKILDFDWKQFKKDDRKKLF